MERSCFQSHWHHSETGWQKWKAWSWGAKCALACEMEGRVAGSWGRHEGRGLGGDGSANGRTGRVQRRSGVSSVQSGCQADCHVSHWDWLLWASGCFGVYIKRTGCEHENTTHFSPPSIPSLASPTPLFFSLPLRLSFSSASHERHIQGAAESLSSGGETACLQGCHDKVQERPGRGEERDRSAEERWPAV